MGPHSDAGPAEQVTGTEPPTPQQNALLRQKLHAGQDLMHQALLEGGCGVPDVAEQGVLDLQQRKSLQRRLALDASG